MATEFQAGSIFVTESLDSRHQMSHCSWPMLCFLQLGNTSNPAVVTVSLPGNRVQSIYGALVAETTNTTLLFGTCSKLLCVIFMKKDDKKPREGKGFFPFLIFLNDDLIFLHLSCGSLLLLLIYSFGCTESYPSWYYIRYGKTSSPSQYHITSKDKEPLYSCCDTIYRTCLPVQLIRGNDTGRKFDKAGA